MHSWEDYLYEIIEPEDYDETSLTDIHEHLSELASNPLNINTAKYEDFCRIPGLTIEQISDIIYYRDTFGDFRTLEELGLIHSIDRQMRLFLSCFFVATPPPSIYDRWYTRPALDSIMKHGHGTALASISTPYSNRNNDSYLGYPYKYSVKLKGKFSDNIKYGIVASQDAGEPFFGSYNKQGFDFYSGFLTVSNIGIMKQTTFGRYRIKIGEGLTLNNGFTLGKQFQLSSLGNQGDGVSITGHSSRSDSHYLQGVATRLKLFGNEEDHANNWNSELALFWSYRKIDATLQNDGTVSTIITSGYHRTENEISKKDNTSEMMTGAHLSLSKATAKGRWHFGTSGVYTWYDRPLNPSTSQQYRLYYPRGNSFWNASLDYGYTSHRLTLSGETATGDCNDIATLNMLSLRLPHEITLTAVQRYYSYKYNAPLANAFSDGGYVRNESGAYLGLSFPLLRIIKASIYTDYSRSAWPKYQVSAASYSWDNNITLTANIRKWTLTGRYRYRQRERDVAGESGEKVLVPRYENTFRLSATWSSTSWTIRTQGDYRIIAYGVTSGSKSQNENGLMLSQMISTKPFRFLTASLSYGYYKTDSYDSRLYMYERGMLESFTSVTFYGEGFRISALLRADISKSWMIIAKCGYRDAGIQLRWKF